jgi:hypothetical protein
VGQVAGGGSGRVAVAVAQWQWQWRGGREKKMSEIGRLLTEIRMIDKVMMVGSGAVAVRKKWKRLDDY